MSQPEFFQSSSTPTRSGIKPEQMRYWLPVDAIIDEGRPAIEWMDFAGVEFDEPFFVETVARVKANDTKRTVVTDLDLLLQFEKIADNLQPSGFIFHASRCGSTLLANAC